jgi:hypothetical protein
MNVHGVVITKNDWGILALSICNAFNHVDVIHVLNHGSSDQTAHGLEILQKIWGDRLKIYTSESNLPWEQALLTNMISSLAESAGADWIYIFDSDELLISKPNFSLKKELSKLSDKVVALRYKTSNYISTFDFEKNNLDDYKKLIYKSKPSQKLDSSKMWDQLYTGDLNFYDLEIFPKIIFRANKNLLVTDGAHSLRWVLSEHLILNSPDIDCAHLMLISKDILKTKSAQGESHIKMGLPRTHGTRNQLINKLDSEGRLDWFWERHSIKTENSNNINPAHIIDETLVKSLNNSIEILKEKFGGNNLSMLFGVPLRSGYAKQTNFTFNTVFQMCKFFDRKVDLLLRLNKKR